MVIYHTDRLHVGIHDRWANKSKTSLFQVLTECLGFFCNSRYVGHLLPRIDDWFIPDELPNIGVKLSKFFLYFKKSFCVIDRRTNFEFIPDNV